jgi:hypothetical protein
MNTSILNGITPQKKLQTGAFWHRASATTLKNDSMELIFELSPLPTLIFMNLGIWSMFSFLKELLQ